MKQELKKAWITALRSGEYQQTTGRLVSASNDSFCCLGVLGKVAGFDPGYIDGWVNEDVDRSYSFSTIELGENNRSHLMSMNDLQGKTFPEIADWIEENIAGETA